MSIDSSLKAIKFNTRLLYGKGFEDGKNSVGNPLEYASKLTDTYSGAVFPEGFELVLNLPNVKSFNGTFLDAVGLKKVIIKGNENGNAVSFKGIGRNKSLETLDLTNFKAIISNLNMAFYYASALREILGEPDFSQCTDMTNAFNGCGNLMTFTPKANTIKLSINLSACPKLNNASKQAIFDGLATVETAQTLTLPSSLKILQSQVDSANAKGWTIAGGTVVSEEEYYG